MKCYNCKRGELLPAEKMTYHADHNMQDEGKPATMYRCNTCEAGQIEIDKIPIINPL